MKRTRTRTRNRRAIWSFAIVMAAALAFVVGAVKIWGVPADKVTSALLGAVLMVAGLALLALIAVAAVKWLKRLLER